MRGLYWDYLVRYRWHWVAGVLLTLCSTSFGLVTPAAIVVFVVTRTRIEQRFTKV